MYNISNCYIHLQYSILAGVRGAISYLQNVWGFQPMVFVMA
jgi:hypothetical protein